MSFALNAATTCLWGSPSNSLLLNEFYLAGWAKRVTGLDHGGFANFIRYFGMANLFQRALDFDPRSTQPRLLIVSTLADHNGALSPLKWGVQEAFNGFVSKLLQSQDVQYRLAETVTQLCEAVCQATPNALMIDAHGSYTGILQLGGFMSLSAK